MRTISRSALAFAVLALLATLNFAETKKAAAKEDSFVITFKDGHTQRFAMSEVEKIEFESATPETVSANTGHFLGRWKVGDGSGDRFYITLKRDGQAYKTLGGRYGTWRLVGDEARITWDDGWRDAIRKSGNGYEKAAFRPGSTFNDDPDNVTSATSLDPI